ncbi:hypothetical protein GCM10010329_07800 [Streptomyces spiroverticillatus]|uniref:Immunity protein 35 domain-containing protein n=1 Tax=Streptomyces finlayi TaxID=67296 RepID=A0A918WTB8_9ACTN|nr:YrhB domain-containing protein [Streptomyces finlayi]GGZ89805.1 hypothetical protein GCM10010329_07800 [Streptomyces spiroverticillatus]GHC80619.1 hypothetical protein GCM10010334_07790 [Streptomyces finlayi]
MDKESARERAARFLEAGNRTAEMPLALTDGEPQVRGSVLYFDCQSTAYLRTGNWRDLAIGSGPVAVDLETGECRLTGSMETAELGL